jgi:hypothetical protein
VGQIGSNSQRLWLTLEVPDRVLDKVDALIADGVLDGERLSAADLQIGATVNLLLAIEDLNWLIEPRPAARVYDQIPGRVPAGTIPAGWLLPAPAPASNTAGG